MQNVFAKVEDFPTSAEVGQLVYLEINYWTIDEYEWDGSTWKFRHRLHPAIAD